MTPSSEWTYLMILVIAFLGNVRFYNLHHQVSWCGYIDSRILENLFYHKRPSWRKSSNTVELFIPDGETKKKSIWTTVCKSLCWKVNVCVTPFLHAARTQTWQTGCEVGVGRVLFQPRADYLSTIESLLAFVFRRTSDICCDPTVLPVTQPNLWYPSHRGLVHPRTAFVAVSFLVAYHLDTANSGSLPYALRLRCSI